GASLVVISKATGLGKGSLYHFFPGGKAEMATAVLAEIEAWFEVNIFTPLLEDPDPVVAIEQMLAAVTTYFQSGQRVCLVGALALNDPDDRFVSTVTHYFERWRSTLTEALARAGCLEPQTWAEAILVEIQGGIILTRALNEPQVFERCMVQLWQRLMLQIQL
ncbi:MAG: TetR/AcrR family transcriptional regulator, partial [Cyanobacteria bacterium P01_H01_bin.121]